MPISVCKNVDQVLLLVFVLCLQDHTETIQSTDYTDYTDCDTVVNNLCNLCNLWLNNW